MRELGFAVFGAIALIALGLYAFNATDGSDVWSTGSAEAAPSASATGAADGVD